MFGPLLLLVLYQATFGQPISHKVFCIDKTRLQFHGRYVGGLRVTFVLREVEHERYLERRSKMENVVRSSIWFRRHQGAGANLVGDAEENEDEDDAKG